MIKLFKKLFVVPVLIVLIISGFGCSDPKADTVTAPKDKTSDDRGYPNAPRAISDTKLKALDGEEFSIGDYKGKVVLINLWATWCAPCIKEMPHFIELQNKYGEDGFVMVGLNSDEEGEEEVRAFVKAQKLNYKIGWATPEVADEFVKISKLPGIPQSLLINRSGEMTGMFRGGGPEVIEKLVASVDKIMAEK